MLPRAIRRDPAPARHRVRTFEIRVGNTQQRDPFGDRDPERISLKRGAVFAALRRHGREHDRRAACGGRGIRAREGLVDDRPQRGVIGAVGGREAPAAVVDHAEADATIARARDRLDLAVAHRDRLELALDVARVRVRRSAPRAEVDEIGELRSEGGHRPKIVSETAARPGKRRLCFSSEQNGARDDQCVRDERARVPTALRRHGCE